MASVFSKIIDGELPGHFVWKDKKAVVIMTIQPIKPGHVLVIPREEIDHWDDLPEDLAAHLMLVSQKVTKGIKKAFPCTRVGIMVVGLEVPHTHIHLLPIDSISEMNFAHARPAEQDELAEAALKLRQALTQLGYVEADL